MSLPDALVRALAAELDGPILEASPVGGGCIAHATRLVTPSGVFFLKYGAADVARTFAAEAAGLRALARAGSPLVVPAVRAMATAAEDRPGYLLMTWIEAGRRDRPFWEGFGRGLAALHRYVADRYGFERDTFIGRLPQHNGWTDAWPEFFRDQRLAPQVRMARERGGWQRAWDRPMNALVARLGDLLPEDPPPSMLHGDLWGGNFIVSADGRAALIDPAAYYGHRETDLAMSELFGGFNAVFYAAYREAWPLEPGYDVRCDLYQLYHLINHLNHFGGGYAEAVAAVLRRYG